MAISGEEQKLYEIAAFFRIPVYKLIEEMPHDELIGWGDFFEKQPPGWQDDYRFGLLMELIGSLTGSNIDKFKLFPSLKRVQEGESNTSTVFKDNKILHLMQNAKGGVLLNFSDVDNQHGTEDNT